MLGGDLDNTLAPSIGIRFERVIKTEEGKLNKAAKGFLESLDVWSRANFYIITTAETRKCLAFLVKWRVPYNKVIGVESSLEIPDVARENDFIVYYDLDKDVLQNINTRGNKKTKGELWTLQEASSQDSLMTEG